LVRGFACLHARLHDLDVALPGRFRRSRRRSARPPPPLLRLSTPHSRLELIGGFGRRPGRRTAGTPPAGLRATRLLRAPSFRRYFADRLRAGAGRRSGIGRRQGRVRRGRSLLSRPRGAVVMRSAPGLRLLSRPRIRSLRSRAGVYRWVWMVVRFVCVIRVEPVCARER